MYPDNSWYSHRQVLLRYCGLKKDFPVFASIQHGHLPIASRHYKKHGIVMGKRKFSFAPALVWNSKQVKYSHNKGVNNIFAIGSPFLYMLKTIKINKIKSKGTLLMPMKSTSEVKADYDIFNLIKLVEKKFEAPYTICVGFNEYKKFQKILKKNKIWNVRTCGSRTDKSFLYKLFDYINNHKNIVITFAGTAVLYSLFLKKKVYLIDRLKFKKKDYIIHKNFYKDHLDAKNDFKKFKINFKNLNTNENYLRARKVLGYDNLKTKEELKKYLGIDKIIKIKIAKVFSFFYDLLHGKELRSKGSVKIKKYLHQESGISNEKI